MVVYTWFWQKNHLFTWSSFWSWRVCKKAKYIEKPIHPKRVTVWCGFWSRGIIRPFFFENDQGDAVTVNGNQCRAMLNEFLFTKIEEEDIANIWFQQDGATCHTVFEDRIISRRAVVWPPRSCEVKMSFIRKDDFFFAKIGIFCKSIAGSLPSVVQAYTHSRSAEG